MARVENATNANKLAAQQMKDQARNQAITQVGMAAGFKGYDAYKRGTGLGADGSYKVPDANLDWTEKGMRKLFSSPDTILDSDRLRVDRQPGHIA